MGRIPHGFFAPRSVAILGASETPGKYGHSLIVNLRKFGYTGQIYPVNPGRTEVLGLKCFPSLKEIPGEVDHVGIVVPISRVPAALQDCVDRGVTGATIFTSGYAEAGPAGKAEQDDIVAFARRHDLRLIGPNCNGFVNIGGHIAFTSTGTIDDIPPAVGSMAIVSQSGGLGQVNVMWRAVQAGLRFRYEVSCGNSGDLDVADYVDFLADEPDVGPILLVLEGIQRGPAFARSLAHAWERGKPVLVLKIGRTEEGSKAARSHTGSLTGSDAAFDAVLRRHGALRAYDFDDLYQWAMLLEQNRPFDPAGTAAVSISGGNVSLFADLAASGGLGFASLTSGTTDKLRALMPTFGSGDAANPLDLTTNANNEGDLHRAALDTLAGDPNVSVVVPILTMTHPRFVRDVQGLAEQGDAAVATLWTGGCRGGNLLTPRTLTESGVPTYTTTRSCVEALAQVGHYWRLRARETGRILADHSGERASDTAAALARSATTMPEWQAKELLAGYGVAVPDGVLARTADDVRVAFAGMAAPVAMKLQSSALPHKAASGGVVLGVTTAEDAVTAFDKLSGLLPGREQEIDGVLIETMIPHTHEILIGAISDPTFGTMLTLGWGGPLGVQHRVASRPVDGLRDVDVTDMFDEAGLSEQLTDPSVLAGVAEVIGNLCVFLDECGDGLAELDINPLALGADGAVYALDALIVPTTSTE